MSKVWGGGVDWAEDEAEDEGEDEAEDVGLG